MFRNKFMDRAFVILAALAVGLSAEATHAQEGAGDDEAAARSDEIIVTARRRAERLQETPISITAFSAEGMEERSIYDIGEIGAFTPNLSFGTTGIGSSDSARIHIRGIGQTDFLITTDPGVGIYVDGVYLARSFGSLFDLLDIERVEVLRGPQGTLFGKNTIGGAINVVSAQPHGETEGGVRATFGSFDRIDAKATINVPLVEDRLFARLSVLTANNDGYYENLYDGSRMSGDATIAGRAALRYVAADNVDISFVFEGASKRASAEGSKLVAIEPMGALFFPINLFIGPLGPSDVIADPYTTNSDFTGTANVSNLDMYGGSFTLNWEVNEKFAIKSITAYRELDTKFGADQDGTPLILAHTLDEVEHSQLSQEIQLSGAAFSDKVDWIAGLYFIGEKGDEFNNVDLVPGIFPVIGVDVSIDVINETDNKSYAAFAHGAWRMTDRLSLSAGLRFSDEKKEYFANHTHPLANTVVINDTVDDSWSSLSPKVGVEYRWSDGLMTYVSVSQGFKSGGFNGRPLDNSPGLESFDQEVVWSYEAGLKTELFDNRLRFNTALFYNDYSDIQVTLVALTDAMGNLLISVRNAAEAKIMGFEAELFANPTPAIDLYAGVGFTDADYGKFMDGPIDRSEQDFSFTPKWNVSVGGQYTADLGDFGALSLRADYNYQSEQFLDTVNSAALFQEGYGLLSTRVALQSPEGGWRLAVFGKNLIDKAYMVNGVDASTSFGLSFASFGPPRTWGVELSANF